MKNQITPEQAVSPVLPTDNTYLENLQSFGEHIKASASEMLDIIDKGGDYEDRFNIHIELNGKKLIMELHADAYDRLMSMVETEIEEFIDIHAMRVATGGNKHE